MVPPAPTYVSEGVPCAAPDPRRVARRLQVWGSFCSFSCAKRDVDRPNHEVSLVRAAQLARARRHASAAAPSRPRPREALRRFGGPLSIEVPANAAHGSVDVVERPLISWPACSAGSGSSTPRRRRPTPRSRPSTSLSCAGSAARRTPSPSRRPSRRRPRGLRRLRAPAASAERQAEAFCAAADTPPPSPPGHHQAARRAEDRPARRRRVGERGASGGDRRRRRRKRRRWRG